MPELPEVETTRRGIEPYILNEQVKQLVVRRPNLRWPIPEDLEKLIKGKKIMAVERRAKYLLLRIGDGAVIIHLGMSGSLRIIKADEPPMVHDHVDIVFGSGMALRYTDPRRFGCVLWQAGDVMSHRLLANLGPEPLTDDFDGERLFQLSRKRKVPVKTFVMDNATVVGVGNIYVNEALFAAGIRPTLAAGKITRARYLVLADEIKRVLANAIEQGGTTLKDFVGGDGQPGYFQQQLNVYGRAGKPCVVCKTPLSEQKRAQRATVFCKRCQR